MTKRYWVAAAILATALADIGCVTHCHRGFQKALEHGAEYDVPTPCRKQVHVFMVHGLTPSTDSGLDALRLKLGENGFAKVGIGELHDANWVKREIDCIRFNDPDARFVLLGYDYGGAVARWLAQDLIAKGVPVDGLVLLDPVGCGAAPVNTRTLLITSAKATSSVPHSAKVVVPDASHFGLPANATTVATVTELLKDIVLENCQPPVETVPEWTYPHAPEMRLELTRTPAGEWDFLADKPGSVRPIGTQVVARPATVPATSAGPVVLKR